MKTNYQFYSHDAFLTIGVSSLLDYILSMDISLEPRKLDILLVSNISLLNIDAFCRGLDTKKSYFVIGSSDAWHMLNGLKGLRLEGFIDISKPLNEIKIDLFFMLKGSKSTNATNICPVQTDETILSYREKFVLNCIASGISTSSIAKRLGLSVKTVSSQKRSMMKKLHVYSNQQLIVKARMSNYLNSL
ncbi:helix-turn-helix transcriptional regulator [Hafnia alvei]|uniref:helix-turn-helix transcriptional regulator n=1 Tax=Hafnia alvei TaxID=569 RepID=UPI0024A8884E|nr:LuxR C-terminal-related transcriptional regulator [Hafnia alvei]